MRPSASTRRMRRSAIPIERRSFRVSTDRQGKSGLGLDAQREAVMNYLNGGRWTLIGEFTEIESGKRNDRPELEKALAACTRQKAKL
jgi:DNA invertase Pin-like site-specific DNA recombinase